MKPALNCSNLLKHLINDILDYSQVKHRMLKMSFVPMQVREVVSDVMEMLHFRAYRRKIDLLSTIDPEAPLSITSEPNRVK